MNAGHLPPLRRGRKSAARYAPETAESHGSILIFANSPARHPAARACPEWRQGLSMTRWFILGTLDRSELHRRRKWRSSLAFPSPTAGAAHGSRAPPMGEGKARTPTCKNPVALSGNIIDSGRARDSDRHMRNSPYLAPLRQRWLLVASATCCSTSMQTLRPDRIAAAAAAQSCTASPIGGPRRRSRSS
jgi:hypothetical protein